MIFSPKQKAAMRAIASGGFSHLLAGAIRSGKSYSAMLAFLAKTAEHPKSLHVLAGRSLQAMKAELLGTVEELAGRMGAAFEYKRQDGLIRVGDTRYMVFAGDNEASYTRVRSLTVGSAFVDEATLVPQSFFTELLGRLTYADSQVVCTCNPSYPKHWLKADYLDQGKFDTAWEFQCADNPTLAAETIARYETLFSGAFYDRNIRGLWVDASGIIYSMRRVEPRLLGEIRHVDLGLDYGVQTVSALVALATLRDGRRRVLGGFYHDAAVHGPLTDAQLADKIEAVAAAHRARQLVLPHDAASLRAELRTRKLRFTLRQADLDVLSGIKECMNGFQSGDLAVIDGEETQHLQDELASYQWDDKKQDVPIKENDHAPDAMRYVYYALARRRGVKPTRLPKGL